TNLKSSENHHDTSWRKIFRVTWLVKETPNGAFDLGDGPGKPNQRERLLVVICHLGYPVIAGAGGVSSQKDAY
ncbi:hypothetical protein Moror_3514, partial [Moniliophthora roreri MCA 2997]